MRIRTAVAVAAAVMVSPYLPVGIQTDSAHADPMVEAECVVRDSEDHIITFGEAAPGLTEATEGTLDLSNQFPSIYQGGAVCSNQRSIEVYTKDATISFRKAVEELTSKYPEVTLRIVDIPLTADQLQKSMEMLLESTRDLDIQELYPNLSKGSVTVVTTGTPAQAKRLSERVRSRIAERPLNNPRVRVFITTQNKRSDLIAAASRYDDEYPWHGGSGVTRDYTGGTPTCSLSAPIHVGTQQLMLTAGHCTGKHYYNQKDLVGTAYSNHFPSKLSSWGDYALISGSSYSNYIWDGGVVPTGMKPISNVIFAGPLMGQHICTSGKTTGTICNQRVDRPDVVSTITYNNSKLAVAHSIKLQHVHESGPLWVTDTASVLPGDSGGTCYWPTRSGAEILGVVSASDKEIGMSICANLKGVREWNSAATR